MRRSAMLLFLGALWGCTEPEPTPEPTPAVDDDSATDDDSSPADDDTAPADDDTSGDDDTVAADYDQATALPFADCAGNQIKMMLGDGTVIGPFDGTFASPTSFSNTNGQWTLRLGTTPAWAAVQGNRTGYIADTDIPLAGPASNPGAAIVNVFVDASQIGGSPAATAGAFGLITNADPRVGGSVRFSALPEPGAQTTGTFSAVLQSQQQAQLGNTVLVGVSGCFSVVLNATDAG